MKSPDSDVKAGIYITVIFHLAVLIILLICQIGAALRKDNSFVIDFSKQEMVVPLENYAFQKSDSARFGDQVKTLPLWKLKEDKEGLMNERDSVKSMQLMTTAASYLFTMRNQLDTSATGITANFEDKDFLIFADANATSGALQRAANTARQLQSNLQSYEFGAYDYTVKLRWTFLELLRRYGQAIACFIMFFIGAPLGALIRKGGL